MQISFRSQLMNADNHYQGNDKRVLCVCSAGLLRSPTIASVLHKDYGYNTRACGTEEAYALVPISTVLMEWAELVVFANKENYENVKRHLGKEQKYLVLDLPDNYSYNDESLVKIIKKRFAEYVVKESESSTVD